jgi:glutamate racemase
MMNEGNQSNRGIGIMDSGVGGLSVLQELTALLPHENVLYYADNGNCPYGTRPVEEICALTGRAVAFLLEQGAKAAVIACNTASTATVAHLRQKWQDVPIIGMVPAVKPAVALSRTGKVGILATQATLKAFALHQVIAQFAKDSEIMAVAPPDLVELIESGKINHSQTRNLLTDYLLPLKVKGMDTLVLGCTHFPFLRPLLTDILGRQVQLVDSGAAVARQTKRVLEQKNLLNPNGKAEIGFFTTGKVSEVLPVMADLLNRPPETIKLNPVR